jgi:hypothetical protein
MNDKIIKWRRDHEASIPRYGSSLIFTIITLVLLIKEQVWLSIVLFVVSLAIHIACVIYMCFGLTYIYLDKEKVWLKVCGKYYEWRWDEVTECKIRERHASRDLPLIYIVTKSEYPHLIFALNAKRSEILMELSTSEIINEQLKKYTI